MEVSAIKHVGVAGMRGPSPFLRLQSDERLVQLTRNGNQAAYEALVARYDARLVAFTRHMLGSREDAEDVVQETFAAAYGAMIADERPLNVKPWLYRIARNRALNHLRRHQAIAVEDFDHHVADQGTTTADQVQRREDFRQLMADVRGLPESQRTALLLREIDALSYEQIAETMETTVPSVKSLLVRARVGLAEAAEARRLTCEEVREELGEVAEGLKRLSPPVRRHLRECDRCKAFREALKDTNRALALMLPVGPLLLLKKLFLAKLGTTAGAGSAAAAGTATTAAGTAAGSATGGVLGAGASAVASKATATIAAAAIVTGGAAGVANVASTSPERAPAVVAQARPTPAPAPTAVPASPARRVAERPAARPEPKRAARQAAARQAAARQAAAPEVAPVPAPEVAPVPAPEVAPVPAPEVAPVPAPEPEPAGGPQEQVDDVSITPPVVEPPVPAPPPAPDPVPPVETIEPPVEPVPPPGAVGPAPAPELVLPPEPAP